MCGKFLEFFLVGKTVFFVGKLDLRKFRTVFSKPKLELVRNFL